MRKTDHPLEIALRTGLQNFSKNVRALHGIKNKDYLDSFVLQLLESIRRVRYVHVVRQMNLSPLRADPSNEIFDPIRAAILHIRSGDIEEACWLVFLFVHFGKPRISKWRLIRDVYGALGASTWWTWKRTSSSVSDFRIWLDDNVETLKGGDGIERRFGNHRKYESLDALTPNGTGSVVFSYVNWIKNHGSHQQMIQNATLATGNDRYLAFDHLYKSMSKVHRFGRTAKFDYLTMLGKLEIAPIAPPLTYMSNSTGPLKGGRLLFHGSSVSNSPPSEVDNWLRELDQRLNVGMQVLEDALCNWQKSPGKFTPFRG